MGGDDGRFSSYDTAIFIENRPEYGDGDEDGNRNLPDSNVIKLIEWNLDEPLKGINEKAFGVVLDADVNKITWVDAPFARIDGVQSKGPECWGQEKTAETEHVQKKRRVRNLGNESDNVMRIPQKSMMNERFALSIRLGDEEIKFGFFTMEQWNRGSLRCAINVGPSSTSRHCKHVRKHARVSLERLAVQLVEGLANLMRGKVRC